VYFKFISNTVLLNSDNGTSFYNYVLIDTLVDDDSDDQRIKGGAIDGDFEWGDHLPWH
jgi:hypothetical protein